MQSPDKVEKFCNAAHDAIIQNATNKYEGPSIQVPPKHIDIIINMVNDLSKTLVPGIELSNAKTIEQLILDKNKSKCSLGSKPGGTHGENKKET